MYAWPDVGEVSPAVEDGLHTAIGDARYVGLGESVHTAGGYAVARATLVRHLVEHDGFRVLAMETPWLRADLARTYLESCRAPDGPTLDPLDAVRVVFPVFADVALRDLFGWMCTWNGAHPDDPVQFSGFDVQQPPHERDRLRVLLGEQDPGLAACPDWNVEPAAACFTALDATDALLAGASETWADEARHLAYGLRMDLVEGDDHDDARDRAMDATFRGLAAARFPEERAVLWAHTGHLRRDGQALRPRGSRRVDLGGHLTARFGADYAPIAFVGSTVRTNWPGMVTPPVVEAPARSLEAALGRATDAPAALVVTSGPPFDRRWSVGGMALVPTDQFVAVAWMDDVAPLVPAFGGGAPMDLTPRPDGGWVVHLRLAEAVDATIRRYAAWELVDEVRDGGRSTVHLRSRLDARVGAVTLDVEGADTVLRSTLPQPAPAAAVADLGEPEAAVRLIGVLASDRASVALTDGAVGVPPALFPESWAGLRVSVVCTTTGPAAVDRCRSPELP